MSEIMQFTRLPSEGIDQILARFRSIRWRAQQGGANVTISIEGIAWLLLRACGPAGNQLVTILSPMHGRFPTTEAELESICLDLGLRRMGHVLEGTYGNIATQLRAPPAQAFVASVGGTASGGNADPWTGGNDPWSAAPSVAMP